VCHCCGSIRYHRTQNGTQDRRYKSNSSKISASRLPFAAAYLLSLSLMTMTELHSLVASSSRSRPAPGTTETQLAAVGVPAHLLDSFVFCNTTATLTAAMASPNTSPSRRKAGEPSALSPMEQLLGIKLLTNSNLDSTKPTLDLTADKDLIALYFSASWCPPCQSFTPKLVQFYNLLRKSKEAKFEIVFVSSDKDLDSFKEYYKKQPWLAIPTDEKAAAVKNNLATELKIRGIPALIVIDKKTGNFVTDQARDDVMMAGPTAADALKVYQKWTELPSVPVDQARFSGGGLFGNSPLGRMLSYLLKNPVYIFGIIYIVKRIMKELHKDSSAGSLTGEPGPGPADEPEF